MRIFDTNNLKNHKVLKNYDIDIETFFKKLRKERFKNLEERRKTHLPLSRRGAFARLIPAFPVSSPMRV